MNPIFLFFAESGFDQNRADKALFELCSEHEELSHLSRSQIQKLIETGNIKVNSALIRSKDTIPEGSKIEITLPAPVSLEVLPENIPLQILYEDEHLAVINKQPGLTVHPSSTQANGTLVNALLYHIKDLSGIGGVLRPGIVHRIDKDTSGAIVITKTDAAHAGLSKLFSTHDIQRVYWALVYGNPKMDETLTVQTTLGRSPQDRKKMAVNVQEGRTAISHFKKIESYGLPNKNPFAAWVEARLETGRTHQVRVHLHHLGHSILGDPAYGKPSENQPKWKGLPHEVQTAVAKLPGQALHARTLGFKHPLTQKELFFEAEPFDDFQELLNSLAKYK